MEIKDGKLYVYYNHNGNKVILENFSAFTELADWCKKNCTENGNVYYLDGHIVLCGYHL